MRRSAMFLLTIICGLPVDASADARTLALPDAVEFPEGVAADRGGTLYVGSITTGAIARFGPGATEAEVLVPAGVLQHGATGLRVDERRDVLWVCDASPLAPIASALVGIDINEGTVIAAHELPSAGGPVLCNDVDVTLRGEIFLTESFAGQVLRVAPRDALSDTPAEVWSSNELLAAPGDPPFGANGIVATRRAVYVVNFNTGALVRIPRRYNGSAGEAQAIPLFEAGAATSLTGADGLLRSGFSELLAVENGVFGGGNRLVRIDLRFEDGQRVGRLEPLAVGLDTPTTVAIADDTAWVAEGQFDHLFGFDPTPPTLPFQLVGIELDDRDSD